MNEYDLIVVGAGPGGYSIAADRAAAGQKVLVIEKDRAGGTCLNRGGIPTKCLCASADVIRAVANAAAFGVEVGGFSADYAKAHERMTSIVDGLRDGVGQMLSRCTVVPGEARITADGDVAVAGELYRAPKVLIATGSKPARLPFDDGVSITSDDLLAMTALPSSIVIIGGGVIGMEFAGILRAFGVEVTVIEYCKEILPPFDAEIAKRLRTVMGRTGIKFIVGAQVTAIERGDGCVVRYTDRKGDHVIEAAEVLSAVGRRPVVPEGLAEAGIEVDRRGFIVTDDRMCTTRPGFYAVGDCNGRLMLAHAAEAQARVAMGEEVCLDAVPSAVFTDPECAMVGPTSEQCTARGIEVRVAKAMFAGNGKAQAMGQTQGLVKTIFDAATDRVLGCHIVGPHAADLIQEMVIPVADGMTAATLRRYVHGHPTLSEVLAATL